MHFRFALATVLALPICAAANADEATFWNEVGLKVVKSAMIPPPTIARALAISSIAQADAFSAVRRSRLGFVYKGMTDEVGVSEEVAVATAAAKALKGVFPEQAFIVEEAWRRRIVALKKMPKFYEASRIGEEAANAILRMRWDDGSESAQYTDPGGTGVGEWRPVKILEEPDLKRYEPSVLPGWKYVRPFVIPSADSCRPEGKIDMQSREYIDAVDEVRRLGGRVSKERTPEQTLIAQFWQGQGGTLTPVGQWNDLATRVAVQEKRTLEQNVTMYAVMNVAIADACLAAWEFKYLTRMWRPQTAIREADKVGIPDMKADPEWRSLLVTPNHPSCVSGHSAISWSAAEALKACFKTDKIHIQVASDSTKNWQTREFSSFSQVANECGRSRIYGGIHFQFDNTMGAELGGKVAGYVLNSSWAKALLQ